MDVNPALLPLIRDGDISLRTIERRLKCQGRDTEYADRSNAIAQRRKIIEAMELPKPPDVVVPDGIYQGDAVELMRRIESGTISLIATSIPYPCSVEYDNTPAFDGNYPAYLDRLRPFFAEAKRTLRTGGRLAINFDLTSVQKHGIEEMPGTFPNLRNLWKDLSTIAEDENGLLFFDYKCWYKQNCCAGFSAKGSVGSCRAPRGNFNNEHILVWSKAFTVLEGPPDCIDIGDDYNSFVISDWYMSPASREHHDSPDFHYAPFPEELAYRLTKLYCYRGDVVLDPFNGSGTTTFVAKALGRHYIGIDLSPLYCRTAERRLAALDGLTPEQMQARIERFLPVDGERVDGRTAHRKRKPPKN